ILVMGLVVGQVLTNGTTFAYAATLERNLLDESKFSDERMEALNDQYQPVTYVYHKITINEAPKIPSQLQNKELVETQNINKNEVKQIVYQVHQQIKPTTQQQIKQRSLSKTNEKNLSSL
ncbi:hypothetical protein OSD48_001972, partial [Enterococcus hirae]|nr:hypothetical protein [Enterococcus hirae]